MVQIFLNSIRNEFPVEQCGSKSPPGVAAYIEPPIEVPVPYTPTNEICYVDLIIALDMGCMNFDEYATGKAQTQIDEYHHSRCVSNCGIQFLEPFLRPRVKLNFMIKPKSNCLKSNSSTKVKYS